LQRDPVLRDIIAAVGPCTLRPQRDHFLLLCRAIYSQQISTAVAAVLFGRFREQFLRRRPTPGRVLNLLARRKKSVLKTCGLSRQKRRYLIDLSRHFLARKIPGRMGEMSDEQIVEALTNVQGIGRWTAEMFLMFVLNRPDVLPVDDLGLQRAVQSAYRLPHRPQRAQLLQIAEPWRPYRTIASWYLWRAADAAGGGWD